MHYENSRGFSMTRHLVPFAALVLGLAGCAGTGKSPAPPPTHQVAAAPAAAPATPAVAPAAPVKHAEAMPPGRTHGMPSVSAVPNPEWYGTRYGRARAVGEALRRDHVMVWDQQDGAYGYYIGGELYAHYQPFTHVLAIRTDTKDETETECRWDGDDRLSVTPAGKEDLCRQLLDQLAQHISRTGGLPITGS